ncbi:MAG: DinB family protein [Bryobacterales bacterium]|nr:DinB family protein [Bryobacteraceae bacterium]MDW8353597.1 DinB family protein [Bryobacterales bacterium]
MRYCLSLMMATAAALAQGPDLKTLIGGAQALQNTIKNYVLKSAEKMPEEHFAFKPVPEVRSFAALLGHIADAQYAFCSAVLGEKNPAPGVEKTKTTKAELTAALQEAFAYCDKAYAISDAQAAELVKFFGAERTKLNVLSFNTAHTWEHYGNLVTYMRMKGIVPPSSERSR